MFEQNKPIHPDMERIYGSISPFELKDKLLGFASEHNEQNEQILLNAGRGNPNWISTVPRQAFFTLGQFAVEECIRTHDEELGLAGLPTKHGCYERFVSYVKDHSDSPGIRFLEQAVNYGICKLEFEPDEWVFELVNGIIGCHYPSPNRMLVHIEKIVCEYLCQELFQGSLEGHTSIYAVEGATAAMCYIFDSFVANGLLDPKDTIAVMVPIFTPYLDIPSLPRYDFNIVYIEANETNPDGSYSWQYPDSEIKKLHNPKIKALFCVNPSNPPSIAIQQRTVDLLVQVVQKHNPNLMIIMDDVYGTFVDHFRSIMAALPFNSIGVYSFSKLFGVTGWRLGTILVHSHNVFDKLIRELPEGARQILRERYASLTLHPDELPFIERLVADSRQVALHHTAGLSTPQQVQMALFSILSLLDSDNAYKALTKQICRRRKRLLYEGLEMDMPENAYDASYYTEFDLLVWAKQQYGEAFACYLKNNYEPIDILFRLAKESSIVLLNGGGFHGPEWSVRVSLANLEDQAYHRIGRAMKDVLQGYVNHWRSTFP